MCVCVLVAGSTVYTCMLNNRGGAEADLTVSRLEPGAACLPLAPQSDGEQRLSVSASCLSPPRFITGWMCLSLRCILFWIYRRLALFYLFSCLSLRHLNVCTLPFLFAVRSFCRRPPPHSDRLRIYTLLLGKRGGSLSQDSPSNTT